MRTKILLLVIGILTTTQAQDDNGHPQTTTSSEEFQRTLSWSIERLKRANFEVGLETPALAVAPDGQFEKLVNDIRKEVPIKGISKGQPGVKYDVILQSGHYGSPSSSAGTGGQLVSERALAAYITNVAAESLRSRYNLSVLVIPANGPFIGLSAKAFLSVHLNGSLLSSTCKNKSSLLYKKGSSPYALHALGYSLSEALGYTYKDFAKDNFTANEGSYEIFSQVQADRLTGLLEVGELRCPSVEKEMINSANLIGRNIAYALDFIVVTPSEQFPVDNIIQETRFLQ